MGQPAIQVEGLTYSYGDIEAVRGISFEVQPGEILGFLGPNGAGKSTTIKMLTGQLPPQGGVARILGDDITSGSSDFQAHIGVCFEEKNLYLDMTAKENLDFFVSLYGLKDVDTTEALRRVGLADRANDRVKSFSKGMRQRMMVARSFINSPKVLFLDEPTDGLDPVSSAAIRATIRQEAERGAAVLLTTHDMFEADELSDRVAFLNEGQIAALDTAENLKLKYGQRAVKVRTRSGDGVHEEVIALGQTDTGERLKAAVTSPELITVHSEEATLEAIFIELTGRGLVG